MRQQGAYEDKHQETTKRTTYIYGEGNCCKPVQLDEWMGDDDLITFNISDMQPPT